MGLFVIIVPVAIFALIMLVWSVFRLGGEIRRNQPIRMKHCLGLFVGLSLLDLLLCGFFIVTEGLGHSAAAEVVPHKCLLKAFEVAPYQPFFLLVLLPYILTLYIFLMIFSPNNLISI